MLRFVVCFVLLGAMECLSAEEVPAPTGEAIVAPTAKLELLYTRTAPIVGGLTEGPAVAPDGSIYFSDIPFGESGGLIVRFDPKTSTTSLFTDNSGKSNGLVFDSAGRLLACEGANFGGRCVSRWDVTTKQKEVLADKFQGKRFNACNDICLDAKGRVYFTDPKYLGAEPRELEHMAVYRLDPESGKVDEVTHEVGKPNGAVISPDGKTLYVADHDNLSDDVTKPAPPKHGTMKIYAFPLNDDGSVGSRRTIVDFGDKKGCDGMTVDAAGNIYLTERDQSRPGVLVVDPNGKEIAFIPSGPANQTGDKPVGLPSNVEFGLGDELNVLYITVDVSLYRIPLKAKGFHVQYSGK